MLNYEQYEKISSEIKSKMILELNESIHENIRELSAKNGNSFDINDILTCIAPEITCFSVNYVDAIMKAVLESSE